MNISTSAQSSISADLELLRSLANVIISMHGSSCDAARRRGRYGHRDATMILMAYRHGLRCSELVALRWDQVDLEAGRLQVIRSKGSDDSVQPLSGVEIRALRKLRRDQPAGVRHVFVSERGASFTANGFFKTLSRAAGSIGMADVHPHPLRHGTGFKLVNQGVDTNRVHKMGRELSDFGECI